MEHGVERANERSVVTFKGEACAALTTADFVPQRKLILVEIGTGKATKRGHHSNVLAGRPLGGVVAGLLNLATRRIYSPGIQREDEAVFEKFLNKVAYVANNPKYLLVTTTIVLFLGAGGYWFFEGIIGGRTEEGPIRSLWWAVVTASTVGYGDAYPETTAGRGVAVLLIISMVTLILPMITALFTAKLIVDHDEFTHEEQEEIKRTLAAIAAKLEVDTAFADLVADESAGNAPPGPHDA